MEILSSKNFGKEAQLEYFPGEYHVVRPGRFVRCAISSKPILLQDLTYWSVTHQEAYASAEIALQAYQKERREDK